MKFIFSILLLVCLQNKRAAAQQSHFLFIQSESRQPFNITLSKKVYSSTATGYLIIPKLAEGQYNFFVGFGGNSIPDQQFSCVIEKKDVGFNLKNFGDKGWALFNLQTFAITMAGEKPNSTLAVNVDKPVLQKVEEKETAPKAPNAFQPDIDAVTKTEDSKAVEERLDSATTKPVAEGRDTIKQIVVEEKSAISTMPLTKDTVIATKEAEKVSPSANFEIEEKEASKPMGSPLHSKGSITKISELKGSEAFYITYIDVQESVADTIQLLIPNSRVADSTPTENTPTKEVPKFLEIETNPKPEAGKAVTVPTEIKEAEPANTGSVKIQPASRCNTTATDDDFLKLRKKMAAASDNDAMISEAKKTFKTLCFTTLQVKNLAYLFLTDESRYHFFDAAYPYVSDTAEFSGLSIMLNDSYYINRFKAMLLN